MYLLFIVQNEVLVTALGVNCVIVSNCVVIYTYGVCRVKNWALKFGVDLWEFGRQFTKMSEIQKVSCTVNKQHRSIIVLIQCEQSRLRWSSG